LPRKLLVAPVRGDPVAAFPLGGVEGRTLDRVILSGALADTSGVLFVALAFEAIDHFTADIKRQRGFHLEDETSGFYFSDALLHVFPTAAVGPILTHTRLSCDAAFDGGFPDGDRALGGEAAYHSGD